MDLLSSEGTEKSPNRVASMSDEGTSNDESELFYSYFGTIEIKRNSEKSQFVLQNYLLQDVSSFCLNNQITDVSMTHNYVFLLVPSEHRIYMLRTDSVFVYCLDLDANQANSGFSAVDIDVKVEKMGRVDCKDKAVPELASLKMQQLRVEKSDFEKIEKFMICSTTRSCFLVKNADTGPSMYRIFTESESKANGFLLLQLGCKEAVVQLCAGNDHILILTVNGEVYSMGTGSRGELGHGSLESEQQPKLVESLNLVKVIQVTCGGWHSVALTEDGDVYFWGWNKCGQLGDCCTVGEIVDTPLPLDIDESVVAIAAYRNETLLRRSDDSVLTFGNANFVCS